MYLQYFLYRYFVLQVVKSFFRVVYFYFVDEELWKEDLLWVKFFLDQYYTMLGEQEVERFRCILIEVIDIFVRFIVICVFFYNLEGGSDLQDFVDNCDLLNIINENSVYVKGIGKCEEIDDISEGGGFKKNLGVICINIYIDSFRGLEDAREIKRIFINYIRMRQWVFDRV